MGLGLEITQSSLGLTPLSLSTILVFLQTNMSPALTSYPACRSAHRADAQNKGRTLSEHSELGRPSITWVSTIQYGRSGRKWFWELLPKQKGLACRGETRQHRKLKLIQVLGKQIQMEAPPISRFNRIAPTERPPCFRKCRPMGGP